MIPANCPGCAASLDAQNRERDYETLQKKAKAYAQENKTPVIIYQDPVLGYQFMEEKAARELGIIPREYIQQY